MSRKEKQSSLPANCVEEEYMYVALQRCECGGPLDTEKQTLVCEDAAPLDVLSTRCSLCSKTRLFRFDISAFYGDLSKYGVITRPSKIIDALEWLTLAVLFIRDAESKSDDEKKLMLGEADFCLDQLFMFYPEGGDVPSGDAFFNQSEGNVPDGRLDLFRRPRIMMLKNRTRDSRASKEE
ncbi:MAG: hypothetical protein ABIH04_03075 [Planctomycetota bacterium]